MLGAEAVSAASSEDGSGASDAEEVRTHTHVSPLKTAEIPLRRVHVTQQVREGGREGVRGEWN